MNETQKKVLLFIGVILIGTLGTLYHRYHRSLEQVYTIGTIDNIYKPAKGNIVASYYYTINGKTYKNSITNYGFEDISVIGNKFLVSVPKGYYGSGVLIFDYPIETDIVSPDRGWTEIPKLK